MFYGNSRRFWVRPAGVLLQDLGLLSLKILSFLSIMKKV